MLSDKYFKVVKYYDNSKDVFPSVDIKGGVAITLRNVNVEGEAIGTFIPYEELKTIVATVKKNNKEQKWLDSVISSRGCYRTTEKFAKDFPFAIERLGKGTGNMIASNFFEILPEVYETTPIDESNYYCFLARINKKRTFCYIKKEYVYENEFISTFNLAFPKSNGSGVFGEKLSSTEIIKIDSGATDTFINIGQLSTKAEAKNLQKYIKTKFLRAMLGVKKATQDNPKSVWSFIPIQDFTINSDINWNATISEIDQQLYKKYKLSEIEITFIEDKVEAME